MHYRLSLLLILFIAGCATTAQMRCRSWQAQGYLLGTIDSCAQCVDTLGSANVEAVRGCSLGLDAAKLFDSGDARRSSSSSIRERGDSNRDPFDDQDFDDSYN